MASVINRSQFFVLPKQAKHKEHERKFRSRKQAEEYQKELNAVGITARIEQPEFGSWEATIRVKDGKGERHEDRKIFNSQQEAEDWAAGEESKVLQLRKENLGIKTNKLLLKEAVDIWFEKKVKGKLRGEKNIAYDIPKVKAIFGERPLDDIKQADIRKFRDDLLKLGYAASTLLNFSQIINGTYKYFIKEKDFKGENPGNIEWPKPDNVKPAPKFDDDDDLDGPDEISDQTRLFNAIQKRSPWILPLVKFALECAARRGEMMALKWSCVRVKEQTVHFPHEKHDWLKPNSELKGRTIPLFPSLEKILDEIQPDKKKRNPDDLIFKGTLNSVTKAFSACAEKAEMELTFHDLRKIGTSRLSKKLSVLQLQAVTGHRDIVTLTRRYYHADLKGILDAITNNSAVFDIERCVVALEIDCATKTANLARYFYQQRRPKKEIIRDGQSYIIITDKELSIDV
jgi:integrase